MTVLQTPDDDVDALTSDGRIVHLRDVGPDDLAELEMLHGQASDESIYLRYFSANRNYVKRYAASLARANDGQHKAIGAFAGRRMVGVGLFERISDASAEFALLVADDCHEIGIGTLLLEHLIAEARAAGVVRFVAEVLASNRLMVEVIRDLGFEPETYTESGDMHVEFGLDVSDRLIAAIQEREWAANEASLRPLLAPRSVVVVGAGQRPGSVGHEVLRNIVSAGFAGSIYVVNPNRAEVLGIASVANASQLPEPVDLAIIALPANQVPAALRALGERGCGAAVLLGAGFGESGPAGTDLQDEVRAIAREHGMRLVGPNCIGIANTNPMISLDATFGALPRRLGPVGVASQSGAFGIAFVNAADAAGLGVSQLVSVGNKIDVGGNDLLLAWSRDPWTRVIAMYLESVGDPRRFARIAREVSRRKPIIAVKSGRTEVGRRAGQTHTAAAASSDVAIDALFRRAGVLRAASTRELLDAARVLAEQPLPRGPRVAVVGNSGGPGILAVDALANAGLQVADFDDRTRAALRDLGAPERSPIDLGAQVSAEQVASVVRAVLDSPEVDSVLTVFTEIAVNDTAAITEAIRVSSERSDKPLLAVTVGAAASSTPLPARIWSVPSFTYPEDAAAALGQAHRYAKIKNAPTQQAARPRGINAGSAHEIVADTVSAGREWLTAAEVHRVLRAYRLPAVAQSVVRGADAAVAAAVRIGYPVALKLASPGLHKSDLGGVRLGIESAGDLRRAVDELLPISDGSLLVQPMIQGGTELIVGAVHDIQCGPLVMFGAGGVLTEILADRTFALAPLTNEDADDLINELRTAPLLDGYRGAPKISRVALRHLLIHVGTLVDDLPEIAELDLNPVIGRADGLYVVDARIRVATPPRHPDSLVRQLRST